ncbi:MAG: sulfatase-like hydrolase/transferase [Gammaproteobacteria bacterium]
MRYWLAAAAALLLLNFAPSFHNIWPTPWITMRAELSMEAAAVVLVLGLHFRYLGRPSNRMLAVATGVLFMLMLGRYMEVTAPALYGRGVNLYWDAQYLPAVAAMLAGAMPAYIGALVITGLIALVFVCVRTLYWALTRVRDLLERPRVAGNLRNAAAALVALYLVSYYASLPTLQLFSIPVTQTYARQAGFVLSALSGEASASLPVDSPLNEIDTRTLPDHDVIVTFVESYGAVAWDEASIAAALETPRQGMLAAIEETGRHVVSAYVEAPTFGGGSWLSHASFMSGIEVLDAASYDALLTQSRRTLPRMFADAGFRTVALMPGLKNQWPEGSFYGFDTIYGESLLDYAGPAFGWWRIPDQFALARLDELELSDDSRAPVFVFFPTISTHMPFRPTPPYQPDWQRFATDSPFQPEVLADVLEQSPQWSDLRPAYADALAYTWDYWSGYLRSRRERDFLLVLLGDHQPPASVSGEGARWHVPVHVVSSDTELVDRLLKAGFQTGLTPGPSPVAAMHELGPLLLRR